MAAQHTSLHPSLKAPADFEADQVSFFRQNVSPGALPSSDQDAIAALSLAREKPSATAALLDPIKERHVPRRRRKARPNKSASSFPQVQAVRGLSKFGRDARRETRDDSGRWDERQWEGHGELSEQILGMSPEQLAEAQAEIEGLLSADSIKFLRERSKGKTESSKETDVGKSYGNGNHVSTKEGNRSRVEKVTTATGNEGDAEKSTEEEREAEKRMWMSDVNENVGVQEEIDSLVAAAVKELGALGRRRFDLEGEALSSEQADSLPMHLGLHHHGSAPAKAGYTLADLLLLTRSSVVTQRILALKILTVLVRRYRNEVLTPLIKSGGLALVFAEFPAYAAFESAKTVQLTYVDAVEAIVGDSWQVPEDELVPGLYFASRFYSGSPLEVPNPCMDVLARSGCLGLLANVARANAQRRDKEGCTRRSLSMIRAIVKNSVVAAKAIVEIDSLPGKILQQLACKSCSVNSSAILLSCDILAQAVVSTGWENDEAVQSLDATILNDGFLRKVSLHLAWFSGENLSSRLGRERKAALGALRMLRAAMAFQRGVMIFTSVAQNVCELSQDIETSAESYLALEAYAHTLYTLAFTATDSETIGTKTTLERGFAQDQLGELIPMAISSARLFISLRSSKDALGISRRAAAGHFTATVFGTTTIPMNKAVIAELLSKCSEISMEMVSYAGRAKAVSELQKRSEALMHMQTLSSVSHAGVRMMSKVSLDPLYAKREVLSFIDCANFEALVLDSSNSVNPWRPIANACVEWIASLAKVDCTRQTVSYGVQLLPMLFDSQVVLDLLARCVLMAKTLSGLSRKITFEVARKCAEDLLPLVLNELRPSSHEHMQNTGLTLGDGQLRPKKAGLISLRGLLDLWINHAEAPDSWLSALKAFYDGGFLNATESFSCLLKSPVKFFLNEEYLCQLFFLANEAYVKDQKLFEGRETVLSSVSTSQSSQCAEALLAMAERLASRGPQPADTSNTPDHLASVVLSVMCDTQADVSLRLSMWRKTITECGGGMLFRNALYIPTSKGVPQAVQEEDSMLSAFSNAIADGLLQGERCPSALAAILALRFNDALGNHEQAHVLNPLKGPLRDRSQLAVLNTIQLILKSGRNVGGTSVLSNWTQQQIKFQNETWK